MMEWNHLYAKGAIEDQNPSLLAYFDILHRQKARAENERQEQHQKEMEQKQKSASSGRSSRRRR